LNGAVEQDLRVTIQALGWEGTKYRKLAKDRIASVAYWCQDEPHAPFPQLPSLADRVGSRTPQVKDSRGLESRLTRPHCGLKTIPGIAPTDLPTDIAGQKHSPTASPTAGAWTTLEAWENTFWLPSPPPSR
jgi:hypothetical protein